MQEIIKRLFRLLWIVGFVAAVATVWHGIAAADLKGRQDRVAREHWPSLHSRYLQATADIDRYLAEVRAGVKEATEVESERLQRAQWNVSLGASEPPSVDDTNAALWVLLWWQTIVPIAGGLVGLVLLQWVLLGDGRPTALKPGKLAKQGGPIDAPAS